MTSTTYVETQAAATVVSVFYRDQEVLAMRAQLTMLGISWQDIEMAEGLARTYLEQLSEPGEHSAVIRWVEHGIEDCSGPREHEGRVWHVIPRHRPHLTYEECIRRYPRLVKALQSHRILSESEAGVCIRDYRDGFSYSCEAISHSGLSPAWAIHAAAAFDHRQTLRRTRESFSKTEVAS